MATSFREIVRLFEEGFGPDALRQVEDDYILLEVLLPRRRSQVVHVRRTNRSGQDRLLVESPIGPVRKRFDPEPLLRANAELLVGAICIDEWEMQGERKEFLLVRASRMLETADREEIEEMVIEVARVADREESELSAQDKM